MSVRKIKIKLKRPRYGVGVAVGMACIIVGLFLAIPKFGGIGVAWTILSVAATAVLYKEGVFIFREIEVDEEKIRSRFRKTPEQKVETLRKMYENQLISKEEYEEKKKRILKE